MLVCRTMFAPPLPPPPGPTGFTAVPSRTYANGSPPPNWIYEAVAGWAYDTDPDSFRGEISADGESGWTEAFTATGSERTVSFSTSDGTSVYVRIIAIVDGEDTLPSSNVHILAAPSIDGVIGTSATTVEVGSNATDTVYWQKSTDGTTYTAAGLTDPGGEITFPADTVIWLSVQNTIASEPSWFSVPVHLDTLPFTAVIVNDGSLSINGRSSTNVDVWEYDGADWSIINNNVPITTSSLIAPTVQFPIRATTNGIPTIQSAIPGSVQGFVVQATTDVSISTAWNAAANPVPDDGSSINGSTGYTGTCTGETDQTGLGSLAGAVFSDVDPTIDHTVGAFGTDNLGREGVRFTLLVLAAPQNPAGSFDGESTTFSCNAVSGASVYKVYRSFDDAQIASGANPAAILAAAENWSGTNCYIVANGPNNLRSSIFAVLSTTVFAAPFQAGSPSTATNPANNQPLYA